MLFSILFWVLLVGVFGRLTVFSFKFSWKLLKVLLSVVLLPLSLIGLVIAGFIKIALPLLLVVAIISLLSAKGQTA